jgi:hypothetical protein
MINNNADANDITSKKKNALVVFTIPPSKEKEKIKFQYIINPVAHALSNLVVKVFHKTTVRLRVEKNKSEEEIKELNDIVFEELDNILETLEEATKVFEGNQHISTIIKDRRDKIARVREEYVNVYTSSYGFSPIAELTGKQGDYTSEELATKYVEYARLKNKPDPSQSELKEYYQISQSTWSRTQKDSEFWDYVLNKTENALKQIEKDKENIFHINSVAANKAEKIRFDQRNQKEIQFIDEAPTNTVLSDTQDTSIQIDRRIDIENKLKSMSHSKMIEVAQKLSPVLDKNDLEQMDNKGLCILIYSLSVSS